MDRLRRMGTRSATMRHTIATARERARPGHPTRPATASAGTARVKSRAIELWAPDGGDRGRVRGVTSLGQPVHLFQGGKHVVVADLLVVGSRLDVRAIYHRRDLVAIRVVVLVPGQDQQAVV